MDGLAIAAALTEINRIAPGASIRTIYQPEQWTFVVHLFARQELRLLMSPRAARIHLTGLDLPHPQTPSPFTMLLRKYLRGGRIVKIAQDGWERAVRVRVVRRAQEAEANLELIGELIGLRGNLILLEGGRVIAALRPDPRAQPGKIYQPLPRQEKLDPRGVSAHVLSEVLVADDPVRALVKRIDGVGKDTAQVIASQMNDPHAFASRIADIISYVDRPVGCYDPNGKRAYFFPVDACEEFDNFSAALDREYEEGYTGECFGQENRSLRRGLERALAKRKRTLNKLARWLNDAEQEDIFRHYGDLIMIHLNDLSRGINRAPLVDPADGSTVEVPLDPRLSPVENAQALYERAKRLRRGRPQVQARKRRLETEISVLEDGLSALAAGGVPSEEALSLIPPAPRQPANRLVPTAPRIYRVDGYTIEVGKNAVQNDSLLRRARPDDLWFHVTDLPGAHVIIHRRGKEEIPARVVMAAARLAAQFSKGGEERRVAVSYTRVKHVRKPRGAPPGLVILTQENTLTVEPYRKKE